MAIIVNLGAGLLLPIDIQPLSTAQIPVGTLAGNNAEEKIIGPFEWTPEINTYGYDSVIMIVSANNDASNINNFTMGETIPDWRLVPNDNNIGQRNMFPVARHIPDKIDCYYRREGYK